MATQGDDAEYLETFQAEFDFVVTGNIVRSISLVFNEGFDNEINLIFESSRELSVFELGEEGAIMSPSYLQFHQDGSVVFSLLFVANSAGGHNNQSDFIEQLWVLAHLGFRASLKESECSEFATEVNVVMDELGRMESTSEIDVLKYYGLFF